MYLATAAAVLSSVAPRMQNAVPLSKCCSLDVTWRLDKFDAENDTDLFIALGIFLTTFRVTIFFRLCLFGCGNVGTSVGNRPFGIGSEQGGPHTTGAWGEK